MGVLRGTSTAKRFVTGASDRALRPFRLAGLVIPSLLNATIISLNDV
jgi:hypothetical protein